MPFDAFLKIEGVPGESQDAKHKDEIEVLSFSFGVAPSSGKKPKNVLQDFRFAKHVDTATPRLLEAACTGDRISQAVLSVRRAGDKPEDFIKITMQEVLVSSHNAGGAPGGGSNLPFEDVALSFVSLEMEVKKQNPDGSFGQPVTSTCSAKGGKSGAAAEEDDDRDRPR